MKVVFLDRDGVINEFPGNGNYVTKLKEFRFLPRALEALRELTEAGYTIFVVSNQAGVGKGIYSKAKLDHITRNMLRDVRKAGGRIRKVFYCVHRTEEGCDCRKPSIGSIRRGLTMMKKPLRAADKAYFVGDTEADILTGRNAGCRTVFVLSGREDRQYMKKWKAKPDYIVRDLYEAARMIRTLNGAVRPKPQKRSAAPRSASRKTAKRARPTSL